MAQGGHAREGHAPGARWAPVTGVLPYRGRTRPQLAIRGKKRPHDEHGRPLCRRGHVVLDGNAVRTGDKGAACKTCANALAWANRHRLFVDDPRVVEHMRKTYERLMPGVDTPPSGG